MKPERWQQISAVFQEAMTLTANERVKFLDEKCAGDFDLRNEVESLLDSHKKAGKVFEELQ